MDTLYHIVSLFQIGKEANLLPLPGAPDAPSELGRPQDIAGRIERQLQRREFKAFADNALCQPYAAFFRPVRNKKISLPQRGSDLFLFRWICADNADPPALIQMITQLIAEKRKLTLEICHCSSFPRPLAMDMDIRQFSVQQRKNKCFSSPAPRQLLPVRAVLPVFFFFPKIFFQFFFAALRFVENNKAFPRIGNEAVLFNRIRMEREHKKCLCRRDRSLGIFIKLSYAVDFIVEKFHSIGMRFIDRKDINDIPAHRKMAAPFHLIDPFISAFCQLCQKGFPFQHISQTDRQFFCQQFLRSRKQLRRF